ncbi:MULTISPECIES: hypothetical protein [unclassified Chelatococcus]|uniref:hypothetical protein n=1 Tax=unclassified Chelatococcus TaxID=2638111 RepID=UPI000314CF0B|nr:MULTISPECIES: hypothetical protein [unclassified Chelatococcus]ALA17184.1 hypothetical protein AL346_06910 [Chelatococcus sp. CO-6]
MLFPETLLIHLPDESRAKAEGLEEAREAAHAAYLAASTAEREAWQEAGLAEARARDMAAMPPGVVRDVSFADAYREVQVEKTNAPAAVPEFVQTARRRHQRALAARDRAAEHWAQFAFVEETARWLERAASFGIGRLEHFAPKPPKTRDFPAEIERIRRELAALDHAWRAAEDAPCPADDLLARATAEIDEIATRGALTLDPRSRGPAPLGLAAKLRVRTMQAPAPVGEAPGLALLGDPGAVLAWLHRDALVERVREMAAALPQRGALSDDEREARFAEISARRLELERLEEAAIVAAEAEGRIIARRRDADPRAILEVREE